MRLRIADSKWLPALLLVSVIVAPHMCYAAVTYPHIAVGGGYETVLTITNPTEHRWNGRLACSQRDFQKFPVLRINGVNIGQSAEYEIKPSATVTFVITGDSTARSGFLKISTAGGPSETQLATSLYYRFRNSAGQVTDTVSTSSAKAARHWVFPVDRGAEADTGVACLTESSDYSPTDVTYTLLSADGAELQRVTKQQRGHLALMLGELFDTIPANFVGSVIVDSSGDTYLLVLRLESGGGTLQLTGTRPARLAPRDRVTRVSFRPHDAVYSKALDRIVAVSAKPNRLHLYDPITNDDQVLELDHLPECLAVDRTGERAVVGHDGRLTFFNLKTREVT
ncbi:MAG: hypothetical protein EHM23_01780, partial [Acidobacteria bacterium]